MVLEGERVIVTGASGFIGSHLVPALLACGAEVVPVDVVTGTDVCDGSAMRPALEGARYLVHLAGIPGVRGSGPQYDRVNRRGTEVALSAALDAGVDRVVLASSSSLYAPSTVPLTESSPLAPRSDYARSKAAAEESARLLCRLRAELVVLRYFTVFGPRQRPDMLCHRLLQSALTGSQVEVFGTGHATRPFTYVSDAVAATVAALTSEDADGTYNVAGSRSVSVLEMAALVEASAGRAPVLVHRPPLPVDADQVQVSVERAFDDLGYVPQVGPEEGIRRQCDAMLRRRDADLGSTATPSSPASPPAR